MRDILEKGVADAVTFPWGSVPLFGIDKVTKYHMDVPLYVTTFAFVFNKDKYNQMSAAQKKVIDDHCTNEWALKVAAPWADFEHAGIAKIKAEAGPRGLRAHARAARASGRRPRSRLRKSGPTNVKKAGGDPAVVMKELKAATRQVQRRLLTNETAQPRRNRERNGGGGTSRCRLPARGLAGGCAAHDNASTWIVSSTPSNGSPRSFVGIVAANIFISVLLRYLFSIQIPDAYDFGRLLLGILIFWGIAATSYRGTHITVDLVWSNVGPR